MLDILDIAREKGVKEGLRAGKIQGLQEGKQQGKQQGLLEGMIEMVIELLVERFGVIPARLSEQIRAIHNQDVLKGLFHQSLQCQSLQEFEMLLNKLV